MSHESRTRGTDDYYILLEWRSPTFRSGWWPTAGPHAHSGHVVTPILNEDNLMSKKDTTVAPALELAAAATNEEEIAETISASNELSERAGNSPLVIKVSGEFTNIFYVEDSGELTKRGNPTYHAVWEQNGEVLHRSEKAGALDMTSARVGWAAVTGNSSLFGRRSQAEALTNALEGNTKGKWGACPVRVRGELVESMNGYKTDSRTTWRKACASEIDVQIVKDEGKGSKSYRAAPSEAEQSCSAF